MTNKPFPFTFAYARREHTIGVLLFSGVNGTPLLRGIEFTHAPSQVGKRMADRMFERKLERSPKAEQSNGETLLLFLKDEPTALSVWCFT